MQIAARPSRVDVAFVAFIGVLLAYYQYYLSLMVFPVWDGAVYLENARNWLNGEPLLEPYRPPLISWIIAGIWFFTGEEWIFAKYLQSMFTVGAGILLYLTLRAGKGSIFALAVTVLTMLNAQLFFWSTQIITEGLSLFFVVLALYLLKSKKQQYWLIAGVAMALTFASRYPIFLQVMVILIAEAIARRNAKLVAMAMAGMVPVLALVVSLVYAKTGTFIIAITRDSRIDIFSPYYVENALAIFGPVFLLVPVAFLFKRTYADRYNFVFMAWFILAFLFWSANAENHQARFMIQLMPAAYFLAVLAIDNIWKGNILSGRLFANLKRPRLSGNNL